ncbi:alpha/beta fold hydrolase [Agrobacterium sp. ICMP 6402]|uniref:alpha/beta hydrolase n=1 Tax=Agrobacterium sp. ICMP 6402 TaxID=2292443 RepID=UPI001295E1CA|nr:alpha/beta fold hydrolase [Agrobacterium sp. ICMP 6402]MQB12365.1 alpha/beta fold hydrolase [Agrobacterium sp. ICMP 6402]
MTKREFVFFSEGVKLRGELYLPADYKAGEKRPTVIVASGRLGLKGWIPPRWMPLFLEAGFVCAAFDYRNLGASDGERGRLFPEEEIRDVVNAFTFLEQQSEVDAERFALVGWGLGGGIAVSVAARDPRIKAVACVNGFGDGERTVRAGVPYDSWLQRKHQLAADRVKRVLEGKSDYISYVDVTHPGKTPNVGQYQDFRNALNNAVGEQDDRSTGLGHGLPDRFTLESAEALYEFRPEREAHLIAPRPLLVMHGEDDDYYPVDEAYSLYQRAAEPKKLVIIKNAGHIDWIETSHPLHRPNVQAAVEWFVEQIGNLPASS